MDKRAKGETDTSKKTANGLGTIDQLPSGLFRWRVSLATSTGKRVRLSGTAKTETLARKALVKAVTDNERGLLSAPDRTTVAEFAQTWLERQTGLSTRTISTYKKEISYALEHIGKMKVRDVRAPHLKSLMTTLAARVMGKRDENGKPKKEDAETMHSRTLGKVLTRLRGIFREAVHDQIIYVNPCDGVKRPKMQTIESVGVVLDFDEKARFHELGEALHAAGACSLWPAIFTALSVGLRRSEVMGLRWQDVDFEAGILSVKHTAVQQDKGVERRETTKTNASRREIEMPSSLRAMLKKHEAHQTLECAKAGSSWRNSGAVFATGLGWWISPDNLNRAVDNVLAWSDSTKLLERYVPENKPTRTAKKDPDMTNLERRMRSVHRDHRARFETIVRAGDALPEITPHDLRHTYATLALRSKVPVAVVSKTLGHARISITLDIYRHVLPSEMKENVFDMFAVPLPVRDVPTVTVN
jgi:integrase